MNVSASERRPGLLRVLIAGGGIAALEAALALRALARDRVEIDLLAARACCSAGS
jgi:aspartate oxidase